MQTPRHRGIRHAALKCRALAPMEQFYCGVLGYQVEWRPDPDNVYLTNGQDSLALHVDPSAAAADSRLDHIGVLVGAPSDVDDWAAHLRTHDVHLSAEPRTHRDGCRSCYALDPEGNKIQFLWHPALSR